MAESVWFRNEEEAMIKWQDCSTEGAIRVLRLLSRGKCREIALPFEPEKKKRFFWLNVINLAIEKGYLSSVPEEEEKLRVVHAISGNYAADIVENFEVLLPDSWEEMAEFCVKLGILTQLCYRMEDLKLRKLLVSRSIDRIKGERERLPFDKEIALPHGLEIGEAIGEAKRLMLEATCQLTDSSDKEESIIEEKNRENVEAAIAAANDGDTILLIGGTEKFDLKSKAMHGFFLEQANNMSSEYEGYSLDNSSNMEDLAFVKGKIDIEIVLKFWKPAFPELAKWSIIRKDASK